VPLAAPARGVVTVRARFAGRSACRARASSPFDPASRDLAHVFVTTSSRAEAAARAAHTFSERMLGTLLILLVTGRDAADAAAWFPISAAAVPLVIAPVAAMATLSAMPLLVPAPFALAAFPLLCVPALVALS
jgi:hypothetical protein